MLDFGRGGRFSLSPRPQTYTTMRRQLSIKELIDIKVYEFANKDAFIMFIQDECEVRGINAEDTLGYVQYAKRRFEHQEKWEALIKKQDEDDKLTADCTWEEFLGSITRVEVGFKGDDGVLSVYRLLNGGLEILAEDESTYERIEIICVPAITNYDFLVYIPAKNVPLEFIKKYVEMHKTKI